MDWAWSEHTTHRLEDVLCGLGAMFFVCLWVRAWRAEKQKTLISKRRSDYYAALSYVTEHPWDADARVACLETGRKYYQFTRTNMPSAQMAALSRDAVIYADISARLGKTRGRSRWRYRFDGRGPRRSRGSWRSGETLAEEPSPA